MAHYIEDPQIAASIDDLTSRWPAIGRAADHPLTEWFIQRDIARQQRPSRAMPVVACSAVLMLVALVFFWKYVLYALIVIVVLAVFAGDFIFGLFDAFRSVRDEIAKRGHKREVGDPDEFFLAAGDPNQWEQVCMLPIPLRSMAGIMIGCGYHDLVSKKRISLKSVLVIVACAGAAVTICLQLFIPADLWRFIKNIGGPFAYILLLASVLPLIYTMESLRRNPSFIMGNFLNQLETSILKTLYSRSNRDRQLSKRRDRKPMDMGVPLLVLFIVNAAWIASSGISLASLIFSLLAWAGLIHLASSWLGEKDPTPEFEELVKLFDAAYQKALRQRAGHDDADSKRGDLNR